MDFFINSSLTTGIEFDSIKKTTIYLLMKNYLFLLLSLVLFTSCQEEITSNLKQIESELKTDNTSSSVFILKNDTILKGKLGTEIFLPKDLFANYSNGKITFELKEFFSKEDMILNGLSTITDKDELLESSGMLYINFTEEGKQLTIKEGKRYKAQLPNKILANSNLYSNDTDSIFKWKFIEPIVRDTIIIDVLKNAAFGLTVDKTGSGGFLKHVPKDSVTIIQTRDSLHLTQVRNGNKRFEDIRKYSNLIDRVFMYDSNLTKEQNEQKNKDFENFYKTENNLFQFSSNTLKWINIDRIMNYESIKNIKFINKNKLGLNAYNIFYNYLEKKSILSDYIYDFKEDYTYNLKIVGKIKVIIYTNDKDKIYYDSFYIDKNSKTDFEINLKETSLDNLKKVLISQ